MMSVFGIIMFAILMRSLKPEPDRELKRTNKIVRINIALMFLCIGLFYQTIGLIPIVVFFIIVTVVWLKAADLA